MQPTAPNNVHALATPYVSNQKRVQFIVLHRTKIISKTELLMGFNMAHGWQGVWAALGTGSMAWCGPRVQELASKMLTP